MLDGSSSPDGGRKVKLVGVMVIEGGGTVDAIGIQLGGAGGGGGGMVGPFGWARRSA